MSASAIDLTRHRAGTSERQMEAADLIWIGFLTLGVILAAFGFRSLRADRAMLAGGMRVPGVVAHLREDESYSDGMVVGLTATFPVLRFTTVEGEEVESVSPVPSRKLKVGSGDQVTVLYDPRNPKRRPRIDTVPGRKVHWNSLGPQDTGLDDPLLIVAGLLLALLGLGMLGLRLWY
jgi:hypothetical protein